MTERSTDGRLKKGWKERKKKKRKKQANKEIKK